SGFVFFLWTFANLVPRAHAIYKRYENEFSTEMTRDPRKRIFPFIY
ncbi:MAG TPA: 3-oxo-5-alpha-steroid 4-dehydrogenase, partial [Bacteroidales bacterium]|nr:3-oxo-5-alpha-steroid 4-dehydrogenase [Bacteroidales bacterium]